MTCLLGYLYFSSLCLGSIAVKHCCLGNDRWQFNGAHNSPFQVSSPSSELGWTHVQSHGVLAAKCVTKTGWSASLQTMRSQSRVKCRKSTSRSTRRQRRTLELSETIFIELVAVPAKVAGPATVAWAASAQQIQAAKVAVSAPRQHWLRPAKNFLILLENSVNQQP